MRFQDLRLAIICFFKSQGRGLEPPIFMEYYDKCGLFQPQDFPMLEPIISFLPESSPFLCFIFQKPKQTQIQEYSVQVFAFFCCCGVTYAASYNNSRIPLFLFVLNWGPAGARASSCFSLQISQKRDIYIYKGHSS